MRGGASLPRMMAAPKRLAHTAGQQTAAVRAGVWPLRVQLRRTQSGPVVDILRSTPKSCCAWPRHPATISPTIFAIRAFDRITGRPDACASCRRCASTNPMQSSSSASAPLRTSETPLAVKARRMRQCTTAVRCCSRPPRVAVLVTRLSDGSSVQLSVARMLPRTLVGTYRSRIGVTSGRGA